MFSPRKWLARKSRFFQMATCHIRLYQPSLNMDKRFRTIASDYRKDRHMLCSGLPPRLYESLKALCCLANASGPLQAHEIAAAADLPPAQTAKILQLMTWAGFVESRKGTKGGFWLVRSPNRIRVTDVADFFARQSESKAAQGHDALLKALARPTARCHKLFSRITIADLAKASGCQPRGFSETPGGSVSKRRRQSVPRLKIADQKRSRR